MLSGKKYRIATDAVLRIQDMNNIKLTITLSEEQKTMLKSLDYSTPEGLHPNEARWRDLARLLKLEIDLLNKKIDSLIY